MSRASSVDRLPPDILAELNRLLSDPRCSQCEAKDQINAVLAAEGHAERLSQSAVNRYAIKMNEVGRRLQERHQVADMWVGKFGRLPQGQLGQLIIQMVHGLAFDAGVQLSESAIDAEAMPATVRMLKDLAQTLEKTERAASLNAERERQIRQQAAEQAARVAEASAKKAGLSSDTINTIRRDVLRMAE